MAQQELGDRTLVERAARGDRAAFGQLYQRYVDDVYAYVHMRVRDVALAEDLTHDVFVRSFKAVPRFEWRTGFAPWLMRIAHNRVANHWRSLGRRPDEVGLPSENDDDESSGPELAMEPEALDEVERRLTTESIVAATEGLTDLQQQVIALRFGAGMSLAETADVMGRTTNAVKNLQHHALAGLRRALLPEESAG